MVAQLKRCSESGATLLEVNRGAIATSPMTATFLRASPSTTRSNAGIRKQLGATLVETAATIMVFLILLVGILEFGRAYSMYQVMTNAAREGARFAVSPCSLAADTACPWGAQGTPPSIGNTTSAGTIKYRVAQFLKSGAIDTGASLNVYVCRKESGGSSADCGTLGMDPCPLVTQRNIDICYTTVEVKAPFKFLFTLFGSSITLKTEARMRDEINN